MNNKYTYIQYACGQHAHWCFLFTVINTVDRKIFVLKIFRKINFCTESFSYERSLTMHVKCACILIRRFNFRT